MGDDFGRGVLISIRPDMVRKIILGEKTVELRKTKAQFKPPFRIYVYCKKGGEQLWAWNYEEEGSRLLNGTVCAEFICDRVHQIEMGEYQNVLVDGVAIPMNGDRNAICLTYKETKEYLKGKAGYGYHISRLKVYRKPMFIMDFYFEACAERVTVAPQNFCYVDLGKKDVEEPDFGPVQISTEAVFERDKPGGCADGQAM